MLQFFAKCPDAHVHVPPNFLRGDMPHANGITAVPKRVSHLLIESAVLLLETGEARGAADQALTEGALLLLALPRESCEAIAKHFIEYRRHVIYRLYRSTRR